MDASPPDPEPSGTEPEHRMPRWVRAFVTVGIIVGLVVVAALALAGGHGPGQHTPRSDGIEAPAGHQPPAGMDH